MKFTKYILGFVLGAASGFAYYYFIGCRTGGCPLQSNPFFSTLFGGIVGALIVDSLSDLLKAKRST